jgi:tetratricopeptide (TPR) repeat protein
MGDFSKALEMEEQSLAVARESKDEYRQVVSLHNICDLLIRLGDLDKALQLTPEIERLNPVLKDLNADIELYKLRGRIFHATNDPEQALVNYQKGLAVANKTNNAAYIAGV